MLFTGQGMSIMLLQPCFNTVHDCVCMAAARLASLETALKAAERDRDGHAFTITKLQVCHGDSQGCGHQANGTPYHTMHRIGSG
jgi:hypothetical protein